MPIVPDFFCPILEWSKSCDKASYSNSMPAVVQLMDYLCIFGLDFKQWLKNQAMIRIPDYYRAVDCKLKLSS